VKWIITTIFNFNNNLYFAPTSFDSDIINPILHNFNQLNMPDCFYPTQYTP